MVPLAEIKTAGVIMAVNTPSDADRASMLELVAVHSSDFERSRPITVPTLRRSRMGTPEECVPNFMIFSALSNRG